MSGSSPTRGSSRRKKSLGVGLRRHLEHLRVAELRDVHAFWAGAERSNGTKRALVDLLEGLMSEEGNVYRRVRTLTRKVLDVLLLLLRREHYASDLPGLFRRLPGEETVELEYHEAEAGLKALSRRGFLAEVPDRSLSTNGRVVFMVPEELGETLTSLFREETRTVEGVMSLARHAASITATERAALRASFPDLPEVSCEDDASIVLGVGGAETLLGRLGKGTRRMVEYALERHAGIMTRTQWTKRRLLKDVRWDRKRWSGELEQVGVGTAARLSLSSYGIACDDEVLVVFSEVLEDYLTRTQPSQPANAQLLQSRGDLIADLCAFLEHVRRNPVKLSRGGEVYKAGRRRIQAGFVFRETFLAGPSEIWNEVFRASEHLGLMGKDDEGFLELRPAAETFLSKPLEEKVRELYRLALEQPGPRGRSLHQHEMRTLVGEALRERPDRWWFGKSLASTCRHRYLATLDQRGIQERHRDRFFSAYFSGRETLADLLQELDDHWLRRLWVLGLLDVAVRDDAVVAWRLAAIGARVLGAEEPGIETGLEPLLVNPDFEVLVLPEGDVSDVIHTLDAFAQRVKTEDVVHFRLTRESVEAAVGAGRSVEDFIAFLEARARGGLPQNVRYTVSGWAGAVTFATLEKGVVLRAESDVAIERILAFPEMRELLVRRLAPGEVLLREVPSSRKLLAALRERGIELQGP